MQINIGRDDGTVITIGPEAISEFVRSFHTEIVKILRELPQSEFERLVRKVGDAR